MSKTQDYFFDKLQQDVLAISADNVDEIRQYLAERLSPAQKRAREDKSRLKAIIASRQVGKTFFCRTELVDTCLKIDDARTLYITLTKGSGRGIMWSDLKQLNSELGLKFEFHNTNLIATRSNGSTIEIVGAENRAEIDKLRGRNYDLIVIDECKSFPPDVLEELITQVLSPALMVRKGTLILIGTPGAILAGPFFDITHKMIGIENDGVIYSRPYESKQLYGKKKYTWSLHRWTLDDAALPMLKEEAYAMKQRFNWSDDDPTWLREYMGKWIASDNALVYYGYNKAGNGYNNWERDENSDNEWGLPSGHEWKFVLGIDLGFTDDVAIEVVAYASTCPIAYQVYDYKSPNLIVPEIAEQIGIAEDIFYEFEALVGDFGGLGKTIMETLSSEYGYGVIPAEKKEKMDHIKLLNADLLMQRIKVLPGSHLDNEWISLQYDHTGQKEHKACANHASDAFLYTWRYLYHHYWREKQTEVVAGSNEFWEKKDLEDQKKAMAKRREANVRVGGPTKSPWNKKPSFTPYERSQLKGIV